MNAPSPSNQRYSPRTLIYITALLTLIFSYMFLSRTRASISKFQPYHQAADILVKSSTTSSNSISPPRLNAEMSTSPNPSTENKNVLQTPLQHFSNNPLTGFFRDGYCRTSATDAGSHTVAGVLSDEFLDFSAARGNNLRAAGLTAGCKWCLCVSRWKEAFDARKGADDAVVPKVFLRATEASALKSVALEDLKMFAKDSE